VKSQIELFVFSGQYATDTPTTDSPLPSDTYNAPPAQVYGAPALETTTTEAPETTTEAVTPSPVYGAPEPSNSYGIPETHGPYKREAKFGMFSSINYSIVFYN
jgi:hypothetical protein